MENEFLEALRKKGEANPLDIVKELKLTISNDELDSFIESKSYHSFRLKMLFYQ